MLVTLFGGFRDRLWWKPPWGLGPSKEGVESVQRGQVSKGTRCLRTIDLSPRTSRPGPAPPPVAAHCTHQTGLVTSTDSEN